MKWTLLTIFFIFCTKISLCQNYGAAYFDEKYEGLREYRNLKRALRHPERVEYLNLSKRKLLDLPPNFSEFVNLKILDLSGNEFNSIPYVVCSLHNLEILNVSSNNLLVINPLIGRLEKLEVLHLMDNKITNVPLEIGCLLNLKILNLTFNELRESDVKFLRVSLPNCHIYVEAIL